MLALWSRKVVQGPESPETVEIEAERELSAVSWVYLGGAERPRSRVVEMWLQKYSPLTAMVL